MMYFMASIGRINMVHTLVPVLLPVLYLLQLGVLVDAAIPSCSSSPAYEAMTEVHFSNRGDDGRVWSACDFPNPRTNWQECGQDGPSWICDPDGLLTSQQVREIKTALREAMDSSACRCKKECDGEVNGHPIIVVIVDWLRIADLSSKSGYCQTYGSCPLRFPQLEPGSREPTTHEWNHASRTFGDQLRQTWDLDNCFDDVILVYSKEYQRAAISAGDIAATRLDEVMDEAVTSARKPLTEGRLKDAILVSVAKVGRKLETTGKAPFIIGMLLVVIVGLAIIFGIIITIVFCVYELRQGKTVGQVCQTMQGGEWAAMVNHLRRPKRERPTSQVQTGTNAEEIPLKEKNDVAAVV